MAASPLLVICMLGRMGDLIAVEPVLRHLAERAPERHRVWYTTPAFAAIYRQAPFFDEIVTVRDEAEYLERKAAFPGDAEIYEFNLKSNPSVVPGKQFPLLTGLTRGAFPECAAEGPRFYFDETAALPLLPERYAVFHCASNGRRRQWPVKNWDRLAGLCQEAGMPVVEIGLHPVLTAPGVVRCTGTLDLQSAAGIIRKAHFFVGMESGFAHLANACRIPGIIIAGKLDGYPDYNPYTGFYAPEGGGCSMVRYFDEYPVALPSAVAATVLERTLSGDPMGYGECEIFCLKAQVRALRRHPLFRIWRALTRPAVKWQLALLAHRRKHR